MACPLHTHVPAGKVRLSRQRWELCWGQRIRRNTCTALDGSSTSSAATTTTTSRDDVLSAAAAGAIKVKVVPPRPPSLPPTPPSLIHSPVYVQKALKKSSADSTAVLPGYTKSSLASQPEEQLELKDGNSLVWALKQVDRSLDELEQNPLPLQKEIYEISRGPVGTATSSALSTAAKVTVAATKEAVKAAVPVGQWVVREGAKAAVSLLSRAMAESAKLQQQQQQKEGSKKKGRK